MIPYFLAYFIQHHGMISAQMIYGPAFSAIYFCEFLTEMVYSNLFRVFRPLELFMSTNSGANGISLNRLSRRNKVRI